MPGALAPLVAATLCAAIALPACDAGSAASQDASNGSSTEEHQTATEKVAPTDPEAAWSQVALPAEKDEVVHAYAEANGTIENTDVEVTLKNPGGSATLRDRSYLTDIVRGGGVNFNRTYEGLVWAADGKDVTYSGTSTKDLPFAVAVTYTLDGTPVDPSSLAGASGHLLIRFDYTNKTTAQDGNEAIHAPLVAITALALDDDCCSNVQATNVKLMDMGSDTLVVGYAMPGLADSLSYTDDVDVSSLGIPDHIQVEADVTNFTLDKTVTLVSTDIFDDVDANFDTSRLQDALGQLQDGVSQLEDGADGLASGTDQLYQGARGLSDGASSLVSGVAAYTSGVKQASQGAAALQRAVSDGASSYTAAASRAAATVQQAQAAYDAAYQAALDDPTSQSVQALGVAAQALADARAAQGQAQGAAAALGRMAGDDGLGGLASGLSTLTDKGDSLATGAAQVSTSASSMADGTAQLSEGASELREGLAAYDQQGIQGLVQVYQDDVVGLKDRLGTLKDATYRNFSGIEDGTQGQVTFLLETDAIRTGE